MDFSIFAQPSTWVSILSLTLMEIVLGIDNVVFISILAGKLPERDRAKLRRIGLMLALVMRIGLLFAISWVMGLTKVLFTMPILDQGINGRDVILLVGGLFLIGKATWEIHDKLEVQHHATHVPTSAGAFRMVLLQVVLLDLVFSLDSVITAVGMVKHVPIMIIAMVLSMLVMLVSAQPIGDFINRHPSMKILALSFLLLIGFVLVAEGMEQHVSKGAIYFAMAFSLVVELINMRYRKKAAPVKLHHRFEEDTP